MKRLLLLPFLILVALCVGCTAEVSDGGSEPVQAEQLHVDHPQEGDAFQICVGRGSILPPNYGAGFLAYKKCPSWNNSPYGPNVWLAHTLHSQAKVLTGSCNAKVINGVTVMTPDLHPSHEVTYMGAPPLETRNYIREDGRRRIVLLDHVGDPSGTIENNACVYVDRND